MIGQNKILLEKINKIEKDFDFDKLELNLKTSNIFRILRITKTEIRHSNFIAWLLDPSESHNLREIYLRRFLLDLEIDIEDIKYKKVEIRREWRNIDLLLIIEDIVICIENKVESKEHSNQLQRYKSIVNDNFKKQKKYFVYLTPYGTEASDDTYQTYSYQQILTNIDHIIQVFERNLTKEVVQYMNDYSEILKIEIMKEHELNDLALKLYNRHKEAFDFIIENKPDFTSEFKIKYDEKVKQSDWVMGSQSNKFVRFQTKNLFEILPKTNGWPLKESFQFEIVLDGKQMTFKTVIAPGNGSENHEKIRGILSKRLESVDGCKIPSGKKWLVHFIKKWKFDLESLQEKSDIEIDKIISKQWIEVSNIVENVEKSIMQSAEELSKMK